RAPERAMLRVELSALVIGGGIVGVLPDPAVKLGDGRIVRSFHHWSRLGLRGRHRRDLARSGPRGDLGRFGLGGGGPRRLGEWGDGRSGSWRLPRRRQLGELLAREIGVSPAGITGEEVLPVSPCTGGFGETI